MSSRQTGYEHSWLNKLLKKPSTSSSNGSSSSGSTNHTSSNSGSSGSGSGSSDSSGGSSTLLSPPSTADSNEDKPSQKGISPQSDGAIVLYNKNYQENQSEDGTPSLRGQNSMDEENPNARIIWGAMDSNDEQLSMKAKTSSSADEDEMQNAGTIWNAIDSRGELKKLTKFESSANLAFSSTSTLSLSYTGDADAAAGHIPRYNQLSASTDTTNSSGVTGTSSTPSGSQKVEASALTPAPENSSSSDGDDSEEMKFQAFLNQFRSLQEQPPSDWIREFVSSDVADNARPPDVTKQVSAGQGPEGNKARVDLNHERSQENWLQKQPSYATFGLFNFSIPKSKKSNSSHPLLSDRDDKSALDFREIPLAYSPSSLLQPWGPNESDRWNSASRLLQSIPEEVASVISTASISLSEKVIDYPNKLRLTRQRRAYFGIMVGALLSVVALALALVILAVINTGGNRAPTPSAPSSAPIILPSFSWQPSREPFQSNIPDRPSLTPIAETIAPTRLDMGGPISVYTDNPSLLPTFLPTDEPLPPPPPPSPSALTPSGTLLRPSLSPSSLPTVKDALALFPVVSSSPSGIDNGLTESPSLFPFIIPTLSPTLSQSSTPTFRITTVSFSPSLSPSKRPIVSTRTPSAYPTAIPKSVSPSSKGTNANEVVRWEPIGEIYGFFPYRDISLSGSGSRLAVATSEYVEVYEKHSDQWTLVGEMLEMSGIRGTSLSGDGKVLVLDALIEANGRSGIYAFRFDGADWVQLGSMLLGASIFQDSVELNYDGSVIAIGSPFLEDYSGEVQIMEFVGINGEWQQKGNVIMGKNPGDFAGTSLSLSRDGSVVAIGCPGSNVNGKVSAGSVAVYQYSPSFGWTRVGSDLQGVDQFKQFGQSVSLSGDGTKVAVGAPLVNPGGVKTGKVYVFRYSIPDRAWQLIGKVLEGSSAADYAGQSVALSSDGNTVAFGAPHRRYAKVFILEESDWAEVGTITSDSDDFGSSICVSSDGRFMAIGGSNDGISSTVDIFQRVDDLPSRLRCSRSYGEKLLYSDC